MLVAAKKKENKHDIRPNLVRSRGTNWRGDRGYLKGHAVKGGAYVSSSDWALHRSRRMGRWSIYSAALRLKFFAPWRSSPRGADGESRRIGARNDVKGLAWCEMKQFLIEQIPALFFIGAFFLMMAMGG